MEDFKQYETLICTKDSAGDFGEKTVEGDIVVFKYYWYRNNNFAIVWNRTNKFDAKVPCNNLRKLTNKEVEEQENKKEEKDKFHLQSKISIDEFNYIDKIALSFSKKIIQYDDNEITIQEKIKKSYIIADKFLHELLSRKS